MVSRIVTALVTLVAAIATYFLLASLGRRVFTGRFRAETAAAAIVVAFIIGSEWSYSTTEPIVQAAATSVTVSALAPANPPAKFAALCTNVRLVPGTGKGNLDGAGTQRPPAVGGAASIELQQTDALVLEGWAVAPNLLGPARAACPVVDGAVVRDAQVAYGTARPDVAAALNNAALTPSAFEIVIAARLIKPGPHQLRVAAVYADGTAMLITGSAGILGPS